MLSRFPDKPNRISQDYLKKLDTQGGYFCSLKKDGFRCVMEWDGKTVTFQSRREMAKGGPTQHPVSKVIMQEAIKFFQQNAMEAGTQLDAEWMARRTEGPEHITVFGILFMGRLWIGAKTEQDRWALISKLKYTPNIQLVECVTSGYLEFFESHKVDPCAEGVVLKHKLSRLIGKSIESADNPLWLKCKWRDGPDGHSTTF